MADFKVIETQEDFDKAIKERLDRKDKELSEFKEKTSAAEAEYKKRLDEANAQIKSLNEKIAGHDKIVSDLTARATAAEGSLLKNRIAHEHGVPLELANRLVGETEEELTKDAESFAAFMAPASAPPLRSNTPAGTDNGSSSVDAAYTAVLASLNQQIQ